jgi:hypothetical protein
MAALKATHLLWKPPMSGCRLGAPPLPPLMPSPLINELERGRTYCNCITFCCKLLEEKVLITSVLLWAQSFFPPLLLWFSPQSGLPASLPNCLPASGWVFSVSVSSLFHTSGWRCVQESSQNQQIYHCGNDSKLHAEWILQAPSTLSFAKTWGAARSGRFQW